jgi:hypothetical protein
MAGDIFHKVNCRLSDLMGSTLLSNHEIEEFVNGILLETLPKNKCVICGSMLDIEGHHFAKWKQDPRTVPVCARCHQQLTEDQKLWDRRCEDPLQPENVKQACILYGIRDICLRRGRTQDNSLYLIYADSLRDDIARLLKGD